MTAEVLWHRADDLVHLRHGDFAARLDLSRPSLGLHSLHLRGQAWESFRLLAPRLESHLGASQTPIEDCFIRGRDLVVTYRQTDDWPVRLQIHWRALSSIESPAAVAGFDVQYSVQTSTLTAQPALAIVSRIPVENVTRAMADATSLETILGELPDVPQRLLGYWCCPLAGARLIYSEMFHPADIVGEDLERPEPGATTLVHHTFAHTLEKGVIMRARARGIFVEADRSAAGAYRDFLCAALPLSA